jgi:hypothetical protein
LWVAGLAAAEVRPGMSPPHLAHCIDNSPAWEGEPYCTPSTRFQQDR